MDTRQDRVLPVIAFHNSRPRYRKHKHDMKRSQIAKSKSGRGYVTIVVRYVVAGADQDTMTNNAAMAFLADFRARWLVANTEQYHPNASVQKRPWHGFWKYDGIFINR